MLRWLAAFSITFTAVLAVGEVIIFGDGLRTPARAFGSYQVYSDGVLVVLGDGDTPDSGYEVPLTDAWFYYSPTNAAQTNTIVDLSGQGNDGTQYSDGYPVFIDNQTTEAPHISLVDASRRAYLISGITNNQEDYTLMFWLKPDDDEGSSSYIMDSGTERLISAFAATSANVGFYDGAWKSFGAGQPAAEVWSLITWEYDASEGSAKYYLNGGTSPEGTNTYTPISIGGSVAIFGAFSGGGSSEAYYDGEASTILAYTNIVSTAARTNFWHDTRTSHGLPAYALNDPQRDSLAVEYPFEYDSAADTSGNENHGTISGATFDNADTNGYLVFDGVNDFAYTVGTSIGGTMTSAVLSAWVNMAVAGNRDTILHQRAAAGEIGITANTDGTKLTMYVNTAAGPAHDLASLTNGAAIGEWTHVVGQWSADVGQQIYVNGVLENETSFTGDGSIVVTDEWLIGKDALNIRYWDGSIDDIKLMTNTYLTAAQVNTLYTNGLAAHP